MGETSPVISEGYATPRINYSYLYLSKKVTIATKTCHFQLIHVGVTQK